MFEHTSFFSNKAPAIQNRSRERAQIGVSVGQPWPSTRMATHIHTPPPPAIKSMSLDLQTEVGVFGLASCQISADLCPASQLQEKLHWQTKKRAPLSKILSFDATQQQGRRRDLARDWNALRSAKQKRELALAMQEEKDNNLVYLYL